ncbi:MAG: MFS transporter [Lachnospiraceae bacterium]
MKKEKKAIKKNELLLWMGNWTSKLGNIVFDYANSVSIVSVFATKTWVLALYQSSETIIQIIFNLLGGAKADSGNRKKIIVITDIISALICFVLSFSINSPVMAEVMIIANALLAIVYAFNSPTYKSIVREVIERDRIGSFNSIQNGGGELIKLAGPFAGVFLVKFIGVRGALIFDGVTFLVSAVMETFLSKLETPVPQKSKTNILLGIKEGFLYLWKEKQILYLVLLSALVNFFLAGHNLLIPYTDGMYAGNLDGFYSKVLAFEAAGGIIGSVISSKIGNKYGEKAKAQVVFLGITGLSLILEPIIALSGMYIICLVMFLVFGIALTMFNIQFMSYIQIRVAEDYLGRVFSIIFTVAVLLMPVGSVVFSFLCDTSRDICFTIVGGGIVVLSMISYFLISSWKEK